MSTRNTFWAITLLVLTAIIFPQAVTQNVTEETPSVPASEASTLGKTESALNSSQDPKLSDRTTTESILDRSPILVTLRSQTKAESRTTPSTSYQSDSNRSTTTVAELASAEKEIGEKPVSGQAANGTLAGVQTNQATESSPAFDYSTPITNGNDPTSSASPEDAKRDGESVASSNFTLTNPATNSSSDPFNSTEENISFGNDDPKREGKEKRHSEEKRMETKDQISDSGAVDNFDSDSNSSIKETTKATDKLDSLETQNITSDEQSPNSVFSSTTPQNERDENNKTGEENETKKITTESIILTHNDSADARTENETSTSIEGLENVTLKEINSTENEVTVTEFISKTNETGPIENIPRMEALVGDNPHVTKPSSTESDKQTSKVTTEEITSTVGTTPPTEELTTEPPSTTEKQTTKKPEETTVTESTQTETTVTESTQPETTVTESTQPETTVTESTKSTTLDLTPVPIPSKISLRPKDPTKDFPVSETPSTELDEMSSTEGSPWDRYGMPYGYEPYMDGGFGNPYWSGDEDTSMLGDPDEIEGEIADEDREHHRSSARHHNRDLRIVGEIKIVEGEEWKEDLKQTDSIAFVALAAKVKQELKQLYARTSLSKSIKRIEITECKEGLIVTYNLLLRTASDLISRHYLLQLFRNHLKDHNQLGPYTLDIDGIEFHLDADYNKPMHLSDTDDEEPLIPQWAIAFIVVAAACLIFSLMFAAVTVYGRSHGTQNSNNTLYDREGMVESCPGWERKLAAAYENIAADSVYDNEDSSRTPPLRRDSQRRIERCDSGREARSLGCPEERYNISDRVI